VNRWSRTLARWLPVVIWMAIIFAFSSQPSFPRGPDPTLEALLRKLAHLTECAILAILVARALGGAATPSRAIAIKTIVIVLAYAISDETHQAFVPNRTPSPVDVLIDSAGALIGLGICYLWATSRRQRDPVARLH
jgi:VanZ family protein